MTDEDPLKVPAAVAKPPTAVAPTITPASTFPAVLEIFNIFSPYFFRTYYLVDEVKSVTLEEL